LHAVLPRDFETIEVGWSRDSDTPTWTRRKRAKSKTSRNFSMDGDTESTNTSIEDKTEDFCDNPTRDALAEGLMCLLKPTIDQLDERVRATRQVSG
jgi:hypothetical protein